MRVKNIAGLCLLVSAAACGGGRPPVATAPAPAPAPDAPPPPPLETVTPIDAAAPTGSSAVIGADLLGSAQYDLPVEANLAVRNELEFLVHQRHAVVGGWMRAAERYHEWVRDVFASHGVPRDLSYLGMIESGYRPTVRSHAGAVGMWQFMPSTGRGMGLRIDETVDERMDPVRATHAAARHLRYLHRRFNGDWSLAAAAYNAGEGRINRGMGRFGARDFWDLANRGDLAQETRRYVPRLYATTIIAKDPVRFGYPAPGPVRRFAFDSVRVDLATPLSVLATVGNLSLNELTELNPHLFRQVAPRDYWVWVPVGQGRALQQAYAASEFRQRGGFGTYRVREGETLTGLAQVAGLTPEQIRALNLSANTDELRAGTSLRLYADAARVLNARPEARVARSEPARGGSRPRVLGDPAPAGEPVASSSTSERRAESSSSTSERRAESSASTERASTASSERGSGSSASGGSASTERRSGLVTAAERRAASAESGSSRASRERASSSSASPSSSAASAERRTGTSTSERASTTERRSASAEGSSTRRASTAEGGSGRTSGERAAAPSSSTASSERRSTPAEGSSSRRASSSESGSSRASSERASAPSSSTGSSSTASSERRSGGSASSSSSSARTHTVADGETLWSIARRYDVTVDAVRAANEMETETIRLGQTLRIPRAASGSSTASSTRADSSTSRRSTASASSTRADSSSRRSGTASGTRTESGSGRTAASSTRPPAGSSSAARPSSPATTGSRPAGAARVREHTVGEGETLWGIARRYETTVDSLRRANDLAADAQIQPGQKLSIPAN
jgi:LysM repeat protein/soluble lytic murein transglycosylase-like protein